MNMLPFKARPFLVVIEHEGGWIWAGYDLVWSSLVEQ